MQDQMLIIEHKMKTLSGVYANACFDAIFGAFSMRFWLNSKNTFD